MPDDSIFRLLLLHETTFHIHREQYKTMPEQKFHFLKKVRKIFLQKCDGFIRKIPWWGRLMILPFAWFGIPVVMSCMKRIVFPC